MRRLRSKPGARWGTATVELALILPLLMFFWVIAVDWARIFYYTVTLQYAARDGAYFGSNYPGIYTYTSIVDAALGETTNITPTPTVTTSYSVSNEGPYSMSTQPPVGYIQVRVSYTFTTITNFPGVPATTPISAAARMRLCPLMPDDD